MPLQHIEVFIDHLEGWWFSQITNLITKKNGQTINSLDLEAQIHYIRDQLNRSSLPNYPEVVKAPNLNHRLYDNHIFKKQLDLININNPNRINRALKNYYQASEQRSRWVREYLLVNDELDIYDEKLTEEWRIRFEQQLDRMNHNNSEPSEEDKIQAGVINYEWVESVPSTPIRNCIETFITRGSYHILADTMKVGWHPDFENLLLTKEIEEGES